MKAKALIPLIVFLVLAGFLAIGLTLNPREVPSALINKPVPAFSLARLDDGEKRFSPEDMRGEVWLLNVWASWCVACRQEHPMLVDMAKRNVIPVVGLNYKEVRGDAGIDIKRVPEGEETPLAFRRAQAWLNMHGNPYVLSVMDINGRVGIDLGVYGVPETFLIDRQGNIRYKHIGPLTPDVLQKVLMPKIEELRHAT